MKTSVIALLATVLSVGAQEAPLGWRHTMGRELFGEHYSTVLTDATFEDVASFNPLRDPIPFDVPAVARIATEWMGQRFEGQPAWLDEPEWRVDSVELREVREDRWVYVVGCRLGLRGSDATFNEHFSVVILPHGEVVEHSVAAHRPVRDYVVAPPPRLAEEDRGKMISLNFHNAPLRHVLEFYASLTGWDISIEDRVSAAITMRPGRRLTPPEAIGMIEDVFKANRIVLEQESDAALIARRWRPSR